VVSYSYFGSPYGQVLTYVGYYWTGFGGADFANGYLSIPRLAVQAILNSAAAGNGYLTDYCNEVWVYTDENGASHTFQNVTSCVQWFNYNPPINITDSTDGSFLRLNTTNPADAQVILKNGDVVHFGPSFGSLASTSPVAGPGAYPTYISDPNGNKITFTTNQGVLTGITDTLGRTITFNSSAGTISYPVAANTTETITGNIAATTSPDISLTASSCPTGQAGLTVYTSGPSLTNDFGTTGTTVTVSIPTGSGTRVYTLTLDSLGELTKVLYPAGGYTRYSYTTYSAVANSGCLAYPIREVDHKYACTLSAGSCSLAQENVTSYTPTLYGLTNETMTVVEPPDAAGSQRRSVYSYSPGGLGISPFASVPREISRSVYGSLTTLLQNTQTSYTNGSVVNYYPFNDLPAGAYGAWSLPSSITTTIQTNGAPQTAAQTLTYNTVSLIPGAESGPFTFYIDNKNTATQTDYSGNVIKTTVYGWQTGGNYAVGTGHILDRMTSLSISDSSGFTATKSYGYDTIGNITSSTVSGTGASTGTITYTNNSYGQPTQAKDPLGEVTTYGYQNAWIDSACPVSSSTASWPTTVTNALKQTTTYLYYSCTGDLASVEDANQNTTSFTYDQIGRTLSITYPDTGQTTYTYEDSPPNSIQTTKLITKSIKHVTNSVDDGLGRVIQNQLTSDTPQGTDYTDTTYDALGRVNSVSNPYRTTSDATYGLTSYLYDALDRKISQTQTDGSALQWCYNGLGSQAVCGSRVGSLTSGTWVDSSDEVGSHSQHISDALGRLTAVLEPNSVNVPSLETDYQYYVTGDLQRVDQWGGAKGSSGDRVRTFTYNARRQKLCAANPEVQSSATCPSSPTGAFPAGAIIYAYDADGNLTGRTAPSPNQPAPGTATVTTTYQHDVLNRLTSTRYTDSYAPNNATPGASYGYDGTSLTGCTTKPPVLTDSNPIGRRTSMCDGSGATSWAHDTMGRVLQERRTIGAILGEYDNDGYNLDGSVASMTSLGFGVSYTYNGAGRPLSVSHSSTILASNATYAAPGELTGLQLGSGPITLNNTYNVRLQPILLSATSPSGPVFSECYDFHLGVQITSSSGCSFSASAAGDNGNVYQIVNNRDTNRSENFVYDSLNRIQQAYSSGKQWGETFGPTATNPGVAPTISGIDAWGNLINRSGVIGKTNTEGLSTSAGTNNQLSSFGYDTAGNMINNGVATYVYDDENRLIATAAYSYIYDGDGRRVEKCTQGTSPGLCATTGAAGTMYWRGTLSEPLTETNLSGNLQNVYIFFNGKRVARSDSTGAIHYYFSSYLGSHAVVENATGSACEQDIDYYPYGGVEEDYCPVVSQNYRFTGKEHDAESGLENFEARYDASSIGRFMTPDDGSDQTVDDPQSWNLYAYVRNQPLRYVDPTGHGVQGATAAASSCAQDQGGGGHTTCNVDTSGTTTAQNAAAATVAAPPVLDKIDEAFNAVANSVAKEMESSAGSFLGALGLVLLSPGTLNSGEDQMVADRNAANSSPPEPAPAAGGAGKGKKPHGNTAGDQYAELYALNDKNGHFLKWGVSQNAAARYSAKELAGGGVEIVGKGKRSDMLWLERSLVESMPGSKNHEPWAGTIP
jgi:RHS repeat-associated protein